MNAEDLIDDTFGLLDDDRREQLARDAATDPALAETLEKLHRAVLWLVDDGETIKPPPDLAARTIALVAQRRQRRTLLDFVPVTVPFRWADVAVAAGILLAGVLTLIPAIQRSRMRMAEAGCAFNLRQVGLGLNQYAVAHDAYPFVPADCPASYVGTYAVLLHDEGHLTDASALHCPCNGESKVGGSLPDFQQLCRQEVRARGSSRHAIGGDYAYTIGYQPPSGRPCSLPVRTSAFVPLLADQPPFDPEGRLILAGNSPNHGGSGQNVLFSDQHVAWKRTRWMGPHDRDLFLNEADRPAPGLHPSDAVLIPAVFRFGEN